MEQMQNGGVQYVPQIAVQYIYLDFDGGLTRYNGEILSLEHVDVRDSLLTADRIADIVAELNTKYAASNVVFVTERPANAEYSTIYIGKTDAFNTYGNFTGLAETVDTGNKNTTDNAFVMLDASATNLEILNTISHEADHLLGTLDHGGEGLNAYAANITVAAGTTSTGIIMTSGDTMHVFSGGVANSTTINSKGSMHISSGGVANSTSVNSGGRLPISSGGVANRTTVNYRGWMVISSGGVANSTTVNSGGGMYISSGGTATDIVASSGAILRITVASETYIKGTYADSAFEMKNAQISGYTVYAGGWIDISSGGTANSTTVNSGGSMRISSGGVANSTTVNGYMYIYSGGTASIAFNPWLGNIYSSVGAVVEYLERDARVYYGGRNAGLVSNADTMEELLISGGHSAIVYSGGVANRTTVNSYGGMFISSGGTANSTTVNFLGSMYISSGGTANSTSVSRGGMFISSGGTANSTTVNSWGYMYISSGGVANSTTVNSWGSMYISSGGVANSTTVSWGYMTISSGGVANSTTVNSGGSMYISSGGTASIVFNPWQGYIYSFAGAVVEYLNRDANVYYGGSNTGLVSKGNSLDELEVASLNSVIIYAGGIANSTTVNFLGYMYISSGGIANSTSVSRGGMFISSGGTANSTTVFGGYMYIFSGGVANSTTVNSGGCIIISSGGVHQGSLQMEAGAVVSAYEGAIIDFTVADRTAGDDYLINDLSLISGTPTYTITISADQAFGAYKLAQGAENFSGSITIGTDGSNYGTLTVGGAVIQYNGVDYRLAKNDDNLDLVIEDVTPPDAPTASADITAITNKNVTVTAVFSSDSVVKEYSRNGNDWFAYESGIVFENNGRIYFRGQDTAGNYSVFTEYIVNNIDKVAPTLEISGNAASWTNQDVTLTASATDPRGATIYVKKSGDAEFVKYDTPVTVAENGNYTFYAVDGLGNASAEQIINVQYIDKDAPTLEISGNAADWTNQDVVLTASVSDGVVEYYDGTQWILGNSLTVTENGVYQFRGTDAAGNITEKSVTVDNIDKTAPEKPVASADTNTITNGNVTVSAEFSTDSVVKEYSLDGKTWQMYTAGVVMTANGIVYFRGTDAAGNVSDVTSFAVENIYKTAPESPVISADITTPTTRNVTLTAELPEDAVLCQYSNDNGPWVTYPAGGITVSANTTIYFRCIDAAGNASDIVSYEVANIDRTAPATPVVSADITTPTNGKVTVSAEFCEDSSIREYNLGNQTWQPYTGAVEFEQNGVIYFRSFDAAGNRSNIATFIVTNIDKTAPVKPVANADIKTPTNSSVFVSARFSNDSVVREYSLDNITWQTYSEAVEMTGNGTVYFRAADIAGNISEVTEYTVSNISAAIPQNLNGSGQGIHCSPVLNAKEYTVEYSTDNFGSVLGFDTATTAVDTYGMPTGNYQWRVNADGGNFASGEAFEVVKSDEPQKYVSDADGDLDVFLGNAVGTWESGYAAEHQGVLNGWNGTAEQVVLDGKNKIADVFSGSTDANILVLTDDTNGDALFVDDVFTAFGKDAARLSQIDEIRAGAGDDIVDMTSQQFAYSGDGVKIYGGAGDDTIWANNGSNTLFGDSGNDRIIGGAGNDVIVGGSGNDRLHGGGGDDTFCFGGNWGNDTVQQLDSSSVTLWFEEGDASGWNMAARTYSDGINTVTVTGVANVTLKFGTDASLPDGAFTDAASEKIFEDKGKNMIA